MISKLEKDAKKSRDHDTNKTSTTNGTLPFKHRTYVPNCPPQVGGTGREILTRCSHASLAISLWTLLGSRKGCMMGMSHMRQAKLLSTNSFLWAVTIEQ